MYQVIRKVTPNKNFSLHVVFDTGEKRLLDMQPFLGFGVFAKLRDYEKFKRVRVVFDTIEWDDGIDLDPEFIYEKSVPVVGTGSGKRET